MTTHFPTVPVDWALREAHLAIRNRFRPLALVVEDDPVIATTVAAILNCSGLAALYETDAYSALETAMIIPPEIVVSDLALPGMNGLDLATEIIRAVPDCEAILFAGQLTGEGLASRIRAPGCPISVLSKPVHPAELLHSVFDILARHGHRFALPKSLRRPSLYDLLSATHLDQDPFFGTSIISHRRRRPQRPSANPA